MKITEDVRAAAEAGMAEKAREFVETGAEVYRAPTPETTASR